MLKNPAVRRSATVTQLVFFALVTGFASWAMGQQPATSSSTNNRSAQQSTSDASVMYRAARDLITDGEWAKAQEKFEEYVSSFANESNLDAAFYWLAYAQHKLARYDQVRTTLSRLLEKYPNSSWKDDAVVLLAQAPSFTVNRLIDAQRPPAAPPIPDIHIYTPDAPISIATAPSEAKLGSYLERSGSDDDPCEFKIVVLQALFQTDVQRGIVAATEWLKPGSTQTARCKSAALSLLGRHGGKAVTPVLLDVAKSEPDVKLRARAIAALGATNDDSVVEPLRAFALNSTENDVVEAAVYALSRHSGDRAVAVLSDIATRGKTTSQRKLAISSIASRAGEPAVDALFRIYEADQDLEIRKAVISGFANRKSVRAGNRLLEIARSSDSIELRKSAISAISRRGGDQAIDFLISLYDTEKSEEVKDQIVSSLGSGNSYSFDTPLAIASGQTVIGRTSRMNDHRVVRKLIEIARSTEAPMERRKRAIGLLSRSTNPEVLKFLEDLLK